MNGADLLEDGFPHSTVEGYRKGCRGGSCLGAIENGYSCARAYQRFNGDPHFRAWVQAGKTPAEIRVLDAEQIEQEATDHAAVTSKARRSVEKMSGLSDLPDGLRGDYVKGTLTRHGTTSGYSAGCRMKDQCPSKLAGGLSCTDAASAYQRERKAIARRGKPVAPVVVKSPAGRALLEEAAASESGVAEVAEVAEVAVDFSEVETVTEQADPDEVAAAEEAARWELDHPHGITREEDEMISAYVEDSRAERLGLDPERFEVVERCSSHLSGHQCGRVEAHEGPHGAVDGSGASWVDSASDEHSTADVFEGPAEPEPEAAAAAEEKSPEGTLFQDGEWWVSTELYARSRLQVEQITGLLRSSNEELLAERMAHRVTSERLVGMALELDVAKSSAGTTRPQFNVTEMVPVPEDPTVTVVRVEGGLQITLGGAAVGVNVQMLGEAYSVAIGA